MKPLLLYIVLLTAFVARAQDTVYLVDGSSKTGKVTEIAPEHIVIEIAGEKETLPKYEVLLVEFKNGSVEVITVPDKTVIHNPNSGERNHRKPQKQDLTNYNLGSVNTLALCNADISAFYERLLPNKKIGLGVMGAYNFNIHASVSNLFIAILNGAKKKYDLGAFANYYPGGYGEENTSFYYGILFKYMSFSFNSVIEEKANVGGAVSTTIKYKPSQGSQLATILTCGTHTRLVKNFFLRSLVGIGGFNLRGDYREQYNYMLNTNNAASNNSTPTTYDRGFLLKFYAGINLGFTF
jgi:hypothetical protein